MAVGFLAILVLAWYHGERGAQRVTGIELVMLAGILVIAGTGLALFTPARGPATDGEVTPTAGEPPPGSIAVLPFTNAGSDPDTESFVVGVHDDVLTQLTKISGLHVTSRTSVLEYRDAPKNVQQIAAELGVAHVLEGGVQRAGDRLRINVQLIDAATDRHLWAETYDRELTAENVFAIQSDIAGRIAEALRTELSPEESAALAAVPTTSLDALDHYHRGQQLYWSRESNEMDQEAIRMFERAVEIDPAFGRAWSGLVLVRSWRIRNGFTTDTMPARDALEQAVRLAADPADSALARGWYHYYGRGDFQRALDHMLNAERLRPGDVEIVQAVGFVLRRLGRFDEAVRRFEGAVSLDPRNQAPFRDLAFTYAVLRRNAEALRVLDRGLLLNPGHGELMLDRFQILLYGMGDTAAAAAFASTVPNLTYSAAPGAADAQIALVRRDYAAALAALARPGPDPGSALLFVASPLQVLYVHRLVGNAAARAAATATLEEARTELARAGDVPDPFGVRRSWHHLRAALALSILARHRAAVAEAEQATRIHNPDVDAIEGPETLMWTVPVHIGAGDHDRAIDILEQLMRIPSLMTVHRLRLDPTYDPLRDDPRFQALLGA
jgi:TolB-like protein